MAVLLFCISPVSFSGSSKSLHSSSVTAVLELFPAPATVLQVNELLKHLPGHDEEELVFQHIAPHAELLFADFLKVFGSTAPTFEAQIKQTKGRHKMVDANEFSHRLSIFKGTLRTIVEQNNFEARHSSHPDRAVFGVTKFADWTWSEFQTLLTKKSSAQDEGKGKADTSDELSMATPTTGCADLQHFKDAHGYQCPVWDGYDCQQAVERYGYTQAEEDDLVENCKSSCNLCNACADTPGFVDGHGDKCKSWVGHDCRRAVEGWRYTQVQQTDILGNCSKSCRLCESALPAPASARPPCSVNWAAKYPSVFRPLNQHSCGGCYAFAAVEELHALSFINSGVDPGELSTQFVVDCFSHGCRGGDAGDVMNWVHAKGGIPTRSDYGCFVGKSTSCKAVVPTTVNTSGAQRFYWERSTARKLCSDGPLSFGVSANSAWQNYVSGVISHHSCPANRANHDTQVVAVLEDKGAWIIRNSWGSNWGVSAKPPYAPNGDDSGFIMIEYGHNACNCQDCNSFPKDVSCVGSCTKTKATTTSTTTITRFVGTTITTTVLCSNTCYWPHDGECDDGGPNSIDKYCGFGTDCGDCGTRFGDKRDYEMKCVDN